MAAVQQAWVEHSAHVQPSVHATYFGARGKSMKDFTVEEGALVPTTPILRTGIVRTSGGLDRVDIDRYGAIVVHGLAFVFTKRVHRIFARFGTADLRAPGLTRLFSKACVEDIFRANLEQDICVKVLRQIRSISQVPVLVHAKPFPPESEFHEYVEDERLKSADPDYLRRTMAVFQEVARTVCTKLDAELLWQDESTCSLPGYTKPEYCLQGLRWNLKEAENEAHMNKEFGWVVLRRLLERLDEIAGGKVLTKTGSGATLIAAQ
ncbi:MAG: hypothetical protein ACJ8EL_07725 [Rhizomicrobium sp.]